MSYQGTLSNEGISFNYDVLSFDIESATMVVKFTPIDADMIITTLNCRFFEDRRDSYLNENGTLIETAKPFIDHLEYAIKEQAPVAIWRSQKVMVNNVSAE